MQTHWLITGVLSASLIACQPSGETESTLAGQDSTVQTIISDVSIRNANPYDTWAEECLAGFSAGPFTDQIFEGIYSGKLKVISYDDGKPLKPSTIREMETKGDIVRERIGKLQCTEQWTVDTERYTFTKKVTRAVLGQELVNEDGTVRGHKALFVVVFP